MNALKRSPHRRPTISKEAENLPETEEPYLTGEEIDENGQMKKISALGVLLMGLTATARHERDRE